jgi:hypothetical protein
VDKGLVLFLRLFIDAVPAINFSVLMWSSEDGYYLMKVEACGQETFPLQTLNMIFWYLGYYSIYWKQNNNYIKKRG